MPPKPRLMSAQTSVSAQASASAQEQGQLHVRQSVQISSPGMTQDDAIELAIACLMRINASLELQSIMMLLQRIDILEASQFCDYATGLTQWKSTFTQKLIRDLNTKVGEWVRGDPRFSQMDILTKSLHTSIVSIANFKMFVDLCGRLHTEISTIRPISEQQHQYVVLFFEFVNKYEFKVEAPPEEVKINLDKVIEIKNWNGQLKALAGLRDMAYRVGNMMSDIDGKEMFKFLIRTMGSMSAVRNNPALHGIISRVETTMLIENQPTGALE